MKHCKSVIQGTHKISLNYINYSNPRRAKVKNVYKKICKKILKTSKIQQKKTVLQIYKHIYKYWRKGTGHPKRISIRESTLF